MCLDNLEQLSAHVSAMVQIRDEQKKLDALNAPEEIALRKISNTEYAWLLALRLAHESYAAEKLGLKTKDDDDADSAEEGSKATDKDPALAG